VRSERRLGGALVCAFGIAYLAVGMFMPTASLGDPLGPKVFPLLLGGFMALLGLVLVIAPDQAQDPADGGQVRAHVAIALTGLLATYGYSLPFLGYPLGTFLFLGTAARLLGERSWRLTIGLSVAVSLGIYLLFTRVLDVSLPLGVLELLKG